MTELCKDCKCWKNEYDINCVPFSGNPNADIYFLGEMAGKQEAQATQITNIPTHFIGTAGIILDEFLEIARINREDVAIANSGRCYKSNNVKPTTKELDKCLKHTIKEIEQIKPKLVVALGGTALYQSTGKVGIEIHRGNLIYSEKLKCNVFPVFHPMATGYDITKKDMLTRDFRRIVELIDKPPTEIKHYPYISIDNVEDFKDIDFDTEEIYFDIETTGLDPYEDGARIILLQLGDGENIYVIDGAILPGIRDRLDTLFKTKKFIGQNFSFDAKWLKVKLDIFPENWLFDTCLAEYLLSGLKNNDLTMLTCKYVPESIGYDDNIISVGGAHKMENISELKQYAADDVGVMFKIRKAQSRALIKNNQEDFMNNIMMPCNKVLTKMSIGGAKYDLDELQKVDDTYNKRAIRAITKAMSLKGVKACAEHFDREFNPRSSLMLKWLLYDYYELPILKRTKNKSPSTDKKVMKKLSRRNIYCKIMVDYRSCQNIRENFLGGILKKLVGDRAHTKYSLHATTTGRPNSKEPNLLNIPREKDIKRILIAEEGHKFVYSDFATIEIRGAAVVYEDDNLIELCNSGGDFHSQIASSTNNIPYDEFYDRLQNGDSEMDKLRTAAKTVSFGVLYQMSAKALSQRIGTTITKAEEFIYNYFKQFPQLERNIERLKQFVAQHGYVCNHYGFYRRWRKGTWEDHGTIREAVNFPIQSLCWNWVQLSLIQIDAELERRNLDSRIALQIYDAIICEALDDEVEETANLMQSIMIKANQTYGNVAKLGRVKLLADVEVGQNLADMEKIL